MRPARGGRPFLPWLLLVAALVAACLGGCGVDVKAKGQMVGGVSAGRGLK